MVNLTDLQNKIQTRIFDNIGSTGYVYTYTFVSDKWDNVPTFSSSTAITMVPYSLLTSDETFEAFGDLQAGECIFVLPYNTTITDKNKVMFDNIVYDVKQIEKYPILDGNLAYAVRCVKEQ